MTNLTNSIVSLALAASAVGFTAPAAAQSADRNAVAAAATDCDTLAHNKNLSEYPAVNQAFVRNSNIGCKFIIAPDGGHDLAQTFDFTARDRAGRSMGEAQYGQQIQAASNRQTAADRQAENRARQEARNNDPVRDMTRQAQDLKNLGNVLKGFKF